MKKLIIASMTVASMALFGCVQNCQKEVPAETATSRSEETLSHNDTEASFVGTRTHKCRGMTSLCPDKCGESGEIAIFKINKYNKYEKLNEYGDQKAETFSFMLESTTGTSDVTPEISAVVKALKPEDEVHLVWDHVYINDNGNHYPERTVRTLKPLKNQ